jgi:hypothetical protein
MDTSSGHVLSVRADPEIHASRQGASGELPPLININKLPNGPTRTSCTYRGAHANMPVTRTRKLKLGKLT